MASPGAQHDASNDVPLLQPRRGISFLQTAFGRAPRAGYVLPTLGGMLFGHIFVYATILDSVSLVASFGGCWASAAEPF